MKKENENDLALQQESGVATVSNFETIYHDVSEIIVQAKETAYRAVDLALLKRNWLLGKRIAEEELNGTRTENYGLEIIKKLSKRLSLEYGKGFESANLYRFVQFYKTYPNIFASVMRQSLLSWTHYLILLTVISDKARKWYEEETIKCSWSVRALKRNIETNMFDRMLITHGNEIIRNEVDNNAKRLADKKLEFIKNPMILEFLEIPENNDYNESKIEKAIISHIQNFLLEMGKGYCFVGRQVRIHADPDNYYVDLVFFNYILNCFVLIDVKRGEITHQDVGQMDMYVRMYDELVKEDFHNPTLGIVLCDETNANIAKYSILNGNEQLFATKYKLCLPSEEELKREIENQKLMFQLQQKDKKGH